MFYIKISKVGFKKITQSKQKISKREMQALLFALAWSRGGKNSLGRVYKYGRAKGQLCWNKTLKNKLCSFMGIKHKQTVRYLNKLQSLGWLFIEQGQFTLTGNLEYKVAPDQYLAPRFGDKYFIFNLSGAGKKSFDIFGKLEKAFYDNDHPAKRDATQLKFNIPERTRRFRKARHKQLKKQKQARKYQRKTLDDRQQMTPIARIDNPSIEKNTLASVKNFNNQEFTLKLTRDTKIKIPWFYTKRLSEFQKTRCGIDPHDRAVWWKGQAFEWNKYFSQYELVPRQPAKSDPRFCKPLESKENCPAKSDPSLQKTFTAEELRAGNAARFACCPEKVKATRARDQARHQAEKSARRLNKRMIFGRVF